MPPLAANWRSWLWPSILVVLAAASVFVLPWYLPPKDPAAGSSYEYGFNNNLAVAGLWATIAIAFLWQARRPSRALDWLQTPAAIAPPYGDASSEYAVVACFGALLAAATAVTHSLLVLPATPEELYFLSRIDLVALGFSPYVDFRHSYGPLMLYVPLWLQRLSAGMLGLEDAYAVCLAFGYVVGFIALFVFFRALALPKGFAWIALGCACLGWTCPNVGLNYAPIRFTLVPAAIVVLHRFARGRPWAGVVAALVACTLCFGVSPEMGLAMTAAAVVYGALLALGGRASRGLAIAAMALASIGIIGMVSPKYLWSLKAFAVGGINFPVFFNLHNVSFVAVSLFVFPALLAAAWQRRTDDRAPLAAALAVAGIALIRPALGRCDPTHVVIYAVIPLGLMFAVAASMGRRAIRIWTPFYVALTTLLFYVGYGSGYAAFYATAIDAARFYATHTELVSRWRAGWKHRKETSPAGGKLTWTKLAPYPQRVGDLLDGGSLYVPIATPADVGIDRILKLQNGFRPPYYPIPISELFLPSDVDRFVADLMRFDLLLLPESNDVASGARLDLAAYERQQNAWLSGLMLFPVRSHVKREPFIAARSLYRELVSRCRVVARPPGKVLLVTPRGQERIQR